MEASLAHGGAGRIHGFVPPQHLQNDRKRAREDFSRHPEVEGEPLYYDGEAEEHAEDEGEEDWGQLPVVDDLEVAALAAEAAMEAVSLRGEGGRQPQASGSTESSSGDDESSSEEESSEDESMTHAPLERVVVSLLPAEDGGVRVQLQVVDDDEDSLDGSDIVDPQVLQEMLEKMNDDGDDARAAAKEAAEMEASMPSVEPLDVEIGADDRLQDAGTVTAVLANQIIVQAPKDSRAVDEGSVLCLSSRHGLGRVEEVFGPVDEPLYTLRFAGGGEMPPEVAAGAPVFSVERFSTYVLPEAVKAAPMEAGMEEEGGEFEFSDDDAEAVFQRLSAAAAGPKPSAPSVAVERSFQSGSRGRGRFGPRPAQGAPPGHNPPSRGGRGGGRGTPGSSFHTQAGMGLPGGRRGRGGHPAPRTQPARGGRGRGRTPPGVELAAPPAGGQWVWVPQDQPQATPPTHHPLPPQQLQYPHHAQRPRPTPLRQQFHPMGPPSIGEANLFPAANVPQMGSGAALWGAGGYEQPFGGSPGAQFGYLQGQAPRAHMPRLQNGPPRWSSGGGLPQQWPGGGGGTFYPNGLPPPS